ncbi:Ubiquitin carboxyl-terminal hydrolase 14 [Nakaseomyces bracarensis]|uniref:Ubiquitin carboxyl-terminal hydrolase n=1 Tax=Nakaseomyces bracarensis TaxID=273131 RepID=A0ABR4NMA8_9SACH
MAAVVLKNLQVPSAIAKDECIYCYETPYNPDKPESESSIISDSLAAEHSLNVCLVCFQAVCPRHTSLHIEVAGHNGSEHKNYLNFAKVRKFEEIDDGNSDDCSSNKKIKLQVVEKSHDADYMNTWTLVHFENPGGNAETLLESGGEMADPEQEKVNAILNAKSQDLVDQTNVWQLDVQTCTHVENFVVPDIEQKQLGTHCSDCDLEQNLWICLHCGNLGCGREQIGIEGHSHALAHYKTYPDHPLAVKLGSLSSSSFDIYCYSCDDEVKFRDTQVLKDTLFKYGIDIENKVADEKTLVELQVEQNMNWDFQMVDEKGQELKHLEASSNLGCGLINLGNSCYLNSVIQCLMNGGVQDWNADIMGDKFSKDVMYPANNLREQLLKIKIAMKEEPERYQNGIRPKSFKKCIGQGHEEFSSGRQQDALEFFSFLVEELDKKLFDKFEANPNDLIKFMMEDRLQCKRCDGVKYSTQSTETIQLPLNDNNDPQSLEERLTAYFSGEIIEFKCPNCNEMVMASKKPALQTYPDTLVINPIRIRIENWAPVKTSNLLEIPGLKDPEETLDLGFAKGLGFQEGYEQLLKDNDDSDDVFKANETFISQLEEMGFSRNASIRALFNTGNSNPELAMNWLFEHIEDEDVNSEFVAPKMVPKNEVDPELIASMVSMGLDPKLCRKALILNNSDVNRSVDWVFNNMDDDGELPAAEEKPQVAGKVHGHKDPSNYRLSGIICHKGNSVQSGHYVAFIRKTIDGKPQWVLYNDEKIVISENYEEMQKNGYILFYSRISN